MPLSKSEYNKLVQVFIKEWERNLNTYNAYVLARQIKEYERIASVFDGLIQELLSKSEGLSPNQIYKLAEYKRFQEEANRQMQLYAQFNTNLTRIAQRDFANSGLQVTQTLLNQINPNFSRLPIEAINKMIGFTADGSPLYNIFVSRFGDRVDTASNIMIDGIARGLNPVEVSRLMRQQLDISRYDATRITRTEALNVYRDVSYDQMSKSGIVNEYIWVAEDDACEECLALESNSPYSLEDRIESPHPHCRCSIAPNIG